MKNIFSRLISLLLLLCIALGCLASCNLIFPDKTPDGGNEHQHVDYVSQLKLDMDSETLKQKVTVKMHIDGDTTHFNAPTSVASEGVIKARYLAVNTPESTGKIEEWGKAASRFTKEKLANAHSIIVESNDDSWNYDGNGRFLVFVWYQPTEGAEYRNLNIELLQEGLAMGSSPMETRYGEIAVNAVAQATIEKLYIFSQNADPEFPYGEATSVTLKELRTNIEEYNGKRVAFEGVITHYGNGTAYVEEYDPEDNIYYGIQIFDGYDNTLLDVLVKGNRVRIVGVVGSFSGTWQITDLKYNRYRPNDPANSTVISRGNEVSFRETTIEEFNGNVSILINDEKVSLPYTQVAVSTSISMKNLYVKDVYTTRNGNSAGAMTLTCEDADGNEIDIRTEVLKDANGNVVTESAYLYKTIDVMGLIDYFDLNNTGNGTYQIKVFVTDDITVH